MPAARQNRSKLADTSSQALPTAPIFVEGNAVGVVLILFMALLSFRGISTPSLPAQGQQRRFFYFNIQRDNPCRTSSPPYRNLHCSPIANQWHPRSPIRFWAALLVAVPHSVPASPASAA